MKTSSCCLCGALVGCVTLVAIALLGIVVICNGGDSLSREFVILGAVGYAPYVAIIGAVIEGIVGAKLAAARIARLKRQSAPQSR
jgi:hypothetical protein